MPRFTDILFVASVACCAIFLAGCSSTAAAERRPNIVLMVSDDQGYRDLGCYGGPTIRTPNLDRLAREGVRLTSFYVTWPACTPSRGSILTGRYPQRNGLYDMIRNDMVNYGHRYTEEEYALSPEMTLGMDLREVMISQVLREAGYATGMIGKWDGGRARRFLPLQRGFDSYFGFANTGIDYWTHERYGIPSMFRGNQRVKEEGYATDLFRDEALKFIDVNKTRPFFLYVAFNAPHSASSLEDRGVQAPREYIQQYSSEDPDKPRTRYMACVTCMDEAIGQIMARLAQHGLTDNTLVLFMSDNGGGGPCDNQPLRGKKGQMFEGGLRVPCIVRFPGRVATGQTRDDLLTALDIFPTFVAAAGATSPREVTLDGFDMLPVLRGDKPGSRQEMFWQRRSDKAARVGNWKWVETDSFRGLFDLRADVGEQQDRSAEKPDVVSMVKSRFDAWRKEMDAAEPRGPLRDY